jgi:hypothetical protein
MRWWNWQQNQNLKLSVQAELLNFMLVRFGDITTPVVIPNHFTDNGNGTITDNLTQLIWQKAPNATAVTWENAIAIMPKVYH